VWGKDQRCRRGEEGSFLSEAVGRVERKGGIEGKRSWTDPIISYNVNFNLNTPGTRTESLEKTQKLLTVARKMVRSRLLTIPVERDISTHKFRSGPSVSQA
jgi:hypothetical protein